MESTTAVVTLENADSSNQQAVAATPSSSAWLEPAKFAKSSPDAAGHRSPVHGRDHDASEEPKFEALQEEADAAEAIRRWDELGPKAKLSTRGGSAHLSIFGEDTAQRRKDAAAAQRRMAALGGEPAAGSTADAGVGNKVEVPLLPANYLRRKSYVDSLAETRFGRDDPREAFEALQQIAQRNTLRQAGTRELFRCRQCGLVAEGKPEDFLKEATLHDPRRARRKCDGCRQQRWQWLRDYAHRKVNSPDGLGVGHRPHSGTRVGMVSDERLGQDTDALERSGGEHRRDSAVAPSVKTDRQVPHHAPRQRQQKKRSNGLSAQSRRRRSSLLSSA